MKRTDELEKPKPKAIIRGIEKEDLSECLKVIHQSFKTVADEFGLTRENCPKHTSFIPLCFLEICPILRYNNTNDF